MGGGKLIKLKEIVDEAIKLVNAAEDAQEFIQKEGGVKNVFMFKRIGTQVNFVEKRDVWADEIIPNMRPYCPVEWMDAEDLLFMLYTSGSTGKPKGIAHRLFSHHLILFL